MDMGVDRGVGDDDCGQEMYVRGCVRQKHGWEDCGGHVCGVKQHI